MNSSIRVREATPRDAGAWNAFVESSEEATSYHRYQWEDVFSAGFRLETSYLIAEAGGEVRGVLPLVRQPRALRGTFYTSLPFFNYGGILADDPAAAERLVEATRQLLADKKGCYAELRHQHELPWDLPVSRRKVRAFRAMPRVPDDLFGTFGSKLRGQIRRAGKEGMTVVTGGVEQLDDFYRIVSVKWREHGSPIYRKTVFRLILERFPNENVLLVVRHADGPVGAGWVHLYRGTAEITWAATLRRYDRFSPNMLLYWEAMKASMERGCHTFDFGRSTVGSGPHRFKQQWSPTEILLPWYYVAGTAEVPPPPPQESKSGEAFKWIWRRTPLAVTRVLGHVIARRLPL